MSEVKINRETFLRALETVEPGLSPREHLEQSTCFIFVDGQVVTYNEEILMRGPSGLPKDIKGAVKADKLLEPLRKMNEDEVRIEQTKGRLTVYGKRREFWVRTEEEIHLPYTSVESPGKWKPLPEEFPEVVQLVSSCCSKQDDSGFVWTCFNIHPEHIEAAEDSKACRWKLNTNFKSPVVVKEVCSRPIARMGVTEFSEGKNWIHFKNNRDFILSVRKYEDEYQSEVLDPWLAETGEVVSLPKGMKEACEKAQVFSADNGSDNLVEVSLTSTRVVLTGEGPLGGYKESAKVNWTGPKVKFMVSPLVLSELVEKYNEVVITPNTLKIQGEHYVYSIRLVASDKKSEDKETEE